VPLVVVTAVMFLGVSRESFATFFFGDFWGRFSPPLRAIADQHSAIADSQRPQ
jgi:hypothetical protein